VSVDAIITGEAVALDLRLARAGSRCLAFAIDAAVVTGLLIAGIYLVVTAVLPHVIDTGGDVALASAALLVTVVGVVVGYPVAFETVTRGRSLGKLALGLRVVRDDGGPIRFRQALVRGLTGFFELYSFSGVPALIVSLASRQGKRVGDYLAGTIVLQERVPSRVGFVPPMPPPLAGWAAASDLSRVTDGLALAIRQFLARAEQLNPEARWDMEVRLASAVVAAVSPPPPPGTPPWAVLAAVLAERRRRQEQRLQFDAAARAAETARQAGASRVGASQQQTADAPPTTDAPPVIGPGGFAPPA
jgi:MYXO-CTERM domain-containing protein